MLDYFAKNWQYLKWNWLNYFRVYLPWCVVDLKIIYGSCKINTNRKLMLEKFYHYQRKFVCFCRNGSWRTHSWSWHFVEMNPVLTNFVEIVTCLWQILLSNSCLVELILPPHLNINYCTVHQLPLINFLGNTWSSLGKSETKRNRNGITFHHY